MASKTNTSACPLMDCRTAGQVIELLSGNPPGTQVRVGTAIVSTNPVLGDIAITHFAHGRSGSTSLGGCGLAWEDPHLYEW